MIREALKMCAVSAGGEDRLPRAKLVVKGQADPAPIYRLRVDDLAFNKANGRIRAEVLEKEAELGRDLDIWNSGDQAVVKEMLLSIRPDENAKIGEDLRRNGQLQPGIITCDGIVINGNRRKALLEELYRATGEEKYRFLEVQVLPSDIEKKELWLIEAGIQLSAPQQLDYSPINHLLKLREGVNAGLRIGDMAARIYGVSVDRIDQDLKRLDLIDEYLRDFLGKEGRYFLVRERNEHFIDLQDILNWVRRPRGRKPPDWNPDDSDINELRVVGFYYIRIKMPHLRIRGLRDLFATEASWKQVKRALEVDVRLTAEEQDRLGFVTTPAEPEDIEEPEGQEMPSDFSTAGEERDLKEEVQWRAVHERNLKSFYEDAKEQEQIVKDSERPLILARRALKNLSAIPSDSDQLGDPEMDQVLAEIIWCTNALRKAIPSQTSKRRVRDRKKSSVAKAKSRRKKKTK